MNPLDNAGTYILFSILIAITAFVYSYVLIQPGEIFSKLYLKLDVLFKTDRRAFNGLGPHPLFKMIMWCEKCVAGQLSIWIFLIYAWPKYLNYNFIWIIPHILFVALTIFLTIIIKLILKNHV